MTAARVERTEGNAFRKNCKPRSRTSRPTDYIHSSGAETATNNARGGSGEVNAFKF